MCSQQLASPLRGDGNHCTYRVMLAEAGGRNGLMLMTPRRAEAKRFAKDFVAAELESRRRVGTVDTADEDRPRHIWVEVWRGTFGSASWQPLSKHQGGYSFEFYDRVVGRKKRRGNREDLISLRSSDGGKSAICVLLEQRSRRGGWRARTKDGRFTGPVTNWRELPESLSPGSEVQLTLNCLSQDKGTCQFLWA